MADLKALLKEARKLVDEKQYKDAQECCKNILRKDKQNYIALVLLGKSFQDSDQAPLAYQKAIASKPDLPLAWQGLASYYEKKEDQPAKARLIQIYKEMLTLQIEEEKVLEILIKLGQIGSNIKSPEALSVISNFIHNKPNNNLLKEADKWLLELLKLDIVCPENDLATITGILNRIYADEPSESLEVLQGKVILQKSDLGSAVEEVLRLNFFKKNVSLREYVCKHLCKKYVEHNMSFKGVDIEKHIATITEGIMNSKYPSLLGSIIAYQEGLYLEAYKQCVPLINYQEADTTEATFIIKCTIMLKKWAVTQKLATNFLIKVKDGNFAVELKKYLFLSLAKQQKWQQAISTLKDVPLETLNMSELACLAECHIEANSPVIAILDSLKDTEYYSQINALLLLKQEKYDNVIQLLNRADNNALNIFYLCKAYWALKQYDNCHINLMKAAKLDPDHADTFLYLGHVYDVHKNDILKARKCYEKAYSLNTLDTNIAKYLSETYLKSGQSETDFELLSTLIKSFPNEAWINFRLGLHNINKREWENAIINFRNVIKSDHKNVTTFECLADAYYSRGSFTSALRAYNKVMTLDSSKSAHCLTRIGYIHSLLTQYEEAIVTFEKVFTINPYSYLALKGIAETWMRIAKKKVAAKTYGTARDCAQNSVNYAVKALSKQKKFVCFWKLLADTLMFITKLPDKYAYADMPTLTDAQSDLVRKNKLEIFPQAIACYSHIAKQKQEVASYDLASAYFSFYFETKSINNCTISFNLAVTCIKEKSTLWRYWNLLGKLCLVIKKYDIAQHCFIKALLVTRKWSVAKIWCNLGSLYLKLKLFKLANYCFWRGQSLLPSYPQSWIGQGLIAEEIREEEAMDLYRHASRLGYHPESALGYADWVCQTLKDNKYKENPESKYIIDGLHAIPAAMDLLEWLCIFEPNNACACNILGILQERSGLLRAALKSYEKALQYGEDDQKKNIALLNIGRVLLRMEKYEESIKVYKAISEASFNSTIGLALALLKNKLFEEAYSVYDTALQWLCNDDNEKADILVAMAGIMYLFKGVDDAKTLLFHSIQVSQKKPTPYSLFAICSLGLIHSDQSLSKLALSELQKYNKDPNYGFDIGFLRSYVYVCEEDMEQAIKLLSDSLHDHPSNALLWSCMAQYCLRAIRLRAKAASCSAQRALCSVHYDDYDCEPAKILATATVAEHLAGDRNKALSLAKQGLHLYPNQAEIWAALLLCLYTHKLFMNKKDWLLAAAGHVRRHLNVPRPLTRWISIMEKKLGK